MRQILTTTAEGNLQFIVLQSFFYIVSLTTCFCTASAQDSYRFERMWPILQQP